MAIEEPEAVRQVREWREKTMQRWEGLSREEITERLRELTRQYREEHNLPDSESSKREAS